MLRKLPNQQQVKVDTMNHQPKIHHVEISTIASIAAVVAAWAVWAFFVFVILGTSGCSDPDGGIEVGGARAEREAEALQETERQKQMNQDIEEILQRIREENAQHTEQAEEQENSSPFRLPSYKEKKLVLEPRFNSFVQYHCSNNSNICGMWYWKIIKGSDGPPQLREKCPHCGFPTALEPAYPVFPHPQAANWSYYETMGHDYIPCKPTYRDHPWTEQEWKSHQDQQFQKLSKPMYQMPRPSNERPMNWPLWSTQNLKDRST